ncbi:MAG: hypothetical protein JWN43_2511 [Gammaproteobacteria bacterium]|nr:hypothetical protein [Gammaproteobacteria bacterium]
MKSAQYFSDDHVAASERFRLAARACGADVSSYSHPERGPNNEALTTHVARLGPRSAKRILILNSGTHGVEGLCGSGCQTAWLESEGPAGLPSDTAVVAVHLINPFGAAWQRRQTEGNVDLNRNFVAHQKQLYPANPVYDRLHPYLTPATRVGADREAADRRLAELRVEVGTKAYSSAILVGQYTQPDGLFYGGRAPVWSNITFRQILSDHCAGADSLAFLEYHTGLGPFGYGMMVTMHPPRSDALSRAKQWYGRSLCASLENIEQGTAADDMPIATGFLASAVEDFAPSAAVTSVALEFGTFPLENMVALFREDAWVHRYGDPTDLDGRAIRRRVEEFFYPRSSDWLDMVTSRSAQVVNQALSGLAAPC